MIFWHLVLVSIIQGLTDPLPISSSGHLVLFHQWVNDGVIEGQAASIAREVDIAVHVGTLFALILYFWQDVKKLTLGGIYTITGKASSDESKALYYLFIASVPAVIAGLLLAQLDAAFFYDLERLAILNIIFGLLLYAADKYRPSHKDQKDMTIGRAFLYGLSQVLALIPGVSRSGITMTAGRAMGFERMAAAKFSLLMALVVTAGAGTLGTYEVMQGGGITLGSHFLWAILMSFVASYIALVLLMKWLQKFSFTPFVIYRVIFGVGLLLAIYSGILA